MFGQGSVPEGGYDASDESGPRTSGPPEIVRACVTAKRYMLAAKVEMMMTMVMWCGGDSQMPACRHVGETKLCCWVKVVCTTKHLGVREVVGDAESSK